MASTYASPDGVVHIVTSAYRVLAECGSAIDTNAWSKTDRWLPRIPTCLWCLADRSIHS